MTAYVAPIICHKCSASGDVPISSILDALAPSKSVRRRLLVHGIFDDDARIISVAARKFIDKARPRVEVTLKWVQS